MGQPFGWNFCALALTFAASTNLGAQQPNDPFAIDPANTKPAANPKSPPAATASKARQPSASSAPAEPRQAKERIQKVLVGPLREPMDFVAQPLRDVVTILEETYDVPIEFDTAALDAVAASPDVEVTLQINNVTLGSALNLMLRNAGAEELTYIVDNEVLLITTQQEAENRSEVKVYRVDDLIVPHPTYTLWDYDADYDRLIDTIVATVEMESWSENGTGEGEIQPFPPGMIVVTQTARVHEQVAALLDSLRATKQAIDADHAEEMAAASREPVTRGFPLHAKGFADDVNRETVIEAIKNSVDWASAEGELADGDTFVLILPERVVVRHRPEVVRQVQLVLHEMTTARTLPPGMGGGIGGGRAKPASKQESKKGRGGF